MCGIAGLINNSKSKQEKIKRMTSELYSRGPDAEGFFINSKAALGHRRLIVIDPENGAQPMIKKLDDGSEYVIIYNGELYNTEEIRKKLKQKGYTFRGYSDTEIVLTSYIEWKEKCLDYFNGIFAFAVYNIKKDKLFIARDRMGVKPLFYAFKNESFIFASEIKSILASGMVDPVVDREGLADIFTLGPSRTPGFGVIKNIYELKPGYYLNYDRINKLSIEQYWDLYYSKHSYSINCTIDRINYLVKDSIERQMISDVPICCFLSGGLDSSIITSVSSDNLEDERINTYSVDYVDNEKYFKSSVYQPNSDQYWINKMVNFKNADHNHILLKNSDLADALDDALIARDLPGMADIDSSLYLFCREVKKNATVVLSGECADEIFGGYPWYYNEKCQGQLFPWINSTDERVKLVNKKVLNLKDANDYLKRRYDETLSEIKWSGEEKLEEREHKIMTYLNLKWFMSTLLDRKDRMSMATGLEVRVPFCDHRIVEYMWNVPWDIKFYKKREKGLLREAFSKELPKEVVWRKKAPYPKTYNPIYLSAVKDRLSSIIKDINSPIREITDKESIKKLIDTNGEIFKYPWFGQLMTGPQIMAYLIQIDIWMRKYNIKIIL